MACPTVRRTHSNVMAVLLPGPADDGAPGAPGEESDMVAAGLRGSECLA